MAEKLITPDYLFEVSWEVCNKVGGIHTVISSKAGLLQKKFNSNYILIGPDVWRGETDNPEFIEDRGLFAAWREAAVNEGLHIRTGRWKVDGLPLAIIVDFTPLIPQKDEIFKVMWERFRLDSISGQWDYVEPVLFGYAAGKLIESFVRFNTSTAERTMAHFHEWMTGSGILYLKDSVPAVTTMFTTHATVIGRSLAGNNQPLYRDFDKFDIEAKAREFNVVSKLSLERLAASNADVYTTVSDLTARECSRFLMKEVDVVTPNGFEERLIPVGETFEKKRSAARDRLRGVAGMLLGSPLSDDALLVAHSGRYEMRNKGIDVFIDSLAALKEDGGLQREVVAFILVPANQIGPRKDLKDALEGNPPEEPFGNKLITHYLHDYDYDQIIQRLKSAGIDNNGADKVKVIFAPCYLNGYDGIFNLPYYDLLIGMDLTVFPSYYEPWGYTPMESVAFGVPTLTTNLAGYGLWVREHFKGSCPAVEVIERDEDNYNLVVSGICEKIVAFSHLEAKELKAIRDNSREVFRITMWENLIEHYYQAYHTGLENAEPRIRELPAPEPLEPVSPVYKVSTVHEPKWKTIKVQKNMPARLSMLDELSRNLWWSWNEDAIELFRAIDRKLWEKTGGNPVYFFEKVSYSRLMELEKDNDFLANLDRVYDRFRGYMERPAKDGPRIAYYSMEYGLHSSLPIYSGGLGILAGDYLKEASDSGVDMVAVGLLYKYGYFRQQLTSGGEQIASYDPTDFTQIPARPVRCSSGELAMISIAFPGRTVKARIWQVDVGRVPLYLLDTDFDENRPDDRSITHHLYGGDWENRFRQEMLLGIGGIRALRVLQLDPDLYHCNEGHAAFIGLERLNKYVNEHKLMFPQALEVVRASTLFTTHTPVPAGHDSFDENLLRTYIAHYPVRLNISWTQFMNLGKIHPDDPQEKFSMSYLAANLSQEINGVSRLHCKVSRRIFNDLWKGYLPEELHIGYVTNGIHHDTWTSGEWKEFYERVLGSDYRENQHRPQTWKGLKNADPAEIWKIRQNHRHRLIDYIIDRTKSSWIKKHESPRYFLNIREKLDPNHLTVGFARRFATYKRAQLLFRDVDRLAAIVNNPKRPVQFIFAGKAHPNDRAGQEVMKNIIGISKRPEFAGKILFLQNYDMDLARMLVRGVDVWLNTPTRPLEASGTSGMKAIMNGVLNFSVLDGWWVEGYRPGAGWALPEERVYDNQDFQDELDADTIYSILEDEIAPMFYTRGTDGIPKEWVRTIKNSISHIAPEFTMRRMLDDYIERFYTRQYKRSLKIRDNEFEMAKQLAAWKRRIYRGWENIEIVDIVYPDAEDKPLMLGHEHTGELVLDLKEVNATSVGVEQVIVDIHPYNGNVDMVDVQELPLLETEGSRARYKLQVYPTKAGAFHYGIRLFPKHPELPHRQDLGFVRWI
jgi:glycogen phosphorylase/synthase